MRARGAQVTDIAVIVVAADDGVMPQTKEAIDHVRAARVPLIIAVNKIDKPDANPDRVKQELSELGVLIEEYGGDIPSVAVSAKQVTGIDELLEVIGLVADLQDLKANPNREAYGTIIESKVEKGRGNVATVLVQTGTLKVGDIVTVGKTPGASAPFRTRPGGGSRRQGPPPRSRSSVFRTCPRPATCSEWWPTRRRLATPPRRSSATRRPVPPAWRTSAPRSRPRGQGAARHPQDRCPGLAGRHPPRPRCPQHGGDPDQHPQRGAGDINESDVLFAAASQAVVVGFNTRLDPGAERAVEASGWTCACTRSSTS